MTWRRSRSRDLPDQEFPLESAALETATSPGVEAHHRGQEHALAAAEDTQGVVEQQRTGGAGPTAGGALQTFRVPSPNRRGGDFPHRASIASKKRPQLRRRNAVLPRQSDQYVLGQKTGSSRPGKWVSGWMRCCQRPSCSAACCERKYSTTLGTPGRLRQRCRCGEPAAL